MSVVHKLPAQKHLQGFIDILTGLLKGFERPQTAVNLPIGDYTAWLHPGMHHRNLNDSVPDEADAAGLCAVNVRRPGFALEVDELNHKNPP